MHLLSYHAYHIRLKFGDCILLIKFLQSLFIIHLSYDTIFLVNTKVRSPSDSIEGPTHNYNHCICNQRNYQECPVTYTEIKTTLKLNPLTSFGGLLIHLHHRDNS